MIAPRINLAVLCGILIICGITQTAEGQHNDISFKHLSTTDGLSNFTVFSIAQDHQGFMWYGTMDGLNRYDGKNIKVYREDPEKPYSLGSNFVNTLLVSGDSGIWIGTNKGLYYYNFHFDDFHNLLLPELTGNASVNPDVKSLLIFDEYLWIGTNSGLYKYDLRGGMFTDFSSSDYNFGTVNALKDTDSGEIWVGHTAGLAYIKNDSLLDSNLKINGVSVKGVISLETDHKNRLWIGTANRVNGLLIYDPENEQHTILSRENGGVPHNRINCMKSFQDGTMWVGTTWGLAIIDEKSFASEHLYYQKHDPMSISQNSIKQIYQGDNGIVWIGTYSGGINYFNPGNQAVTHVSDKYDREVSISFNIVSSVFEDAKGKLWIGTEYGGVNIFDSKKEQIEVLKRDFDDPNSLISNNIKSFAQDKYGRMFIGAQFGMSIYDPSNKSYFNISNEINGIRGRLASTAVHVHDLCKDNNGDIWIGRTGNRSHLLKYDVEKDTIIHYHTVNKQFPTLNGIAVNALSHDKKNDVIWIGGNNGLASFNVGTLTYNTQEAFKGVAEQFQNTIINDVHLDPSGILWIATFGRGLYLLDTKNYQLRKVETDEGLLESSFYGICSDLNGDIWVSLNASLIKISNISNINDKVIIGHFGTQEGFPPQQYFRNAAYAGSDGTIYFGGDDGYVSFRPEEVKNVILNPDVTIVDVRVNGNSLKINGDKPDIFYNPSSLKDISLTYEQSSFSLQFIAPNYLSPENTWYQYQLSGENMEWQDLGNSNSINFTKLKAGDYKLKIRASSDPHEWEPSYMELNISVMPPYWATPWAYVIYIFVILAMLYIFFRISWRWERMSQNLKLEHLEREKEQEFHERRIRFFTDISHELRTPLTLILAPIERLIKSNLGNVKIKNQLMLMLRNGERMLQLVNQLLDLRKLETGHMQLQVANGDLSSFVKEVSLSFREVAESRKIKFEFASTPDQIDVLFDRDKFEIVLFNILSNALKFTPENGKIGIAIVDKKNVPKDEGFGEKGVEITISNSGAGIPEDQLAYIFDRFYTGTKMSNGKTQGSGVGLEIVKKFIELHKGKIAVYSDYDREGVNGQTRFVITLLKGRKHFREDQIIKDFKSSESISGYKEISRESIIVEENVKISHVKQQEEPEQTILIIEDNEEVRSLVVELFSNEYKVLEGSNGLQGLELANKNIPDLIISDVMMPKMDGIEFCRRIKDNIETSHIPVILLTARTAVTFKYEGLETGADDYIIKPFSVDDLKIRSKNLIKQRQNLRDKFTRDTSFLPSDITLSSVDDKLMIKVRDYVIENLGKDNLTVERLAEEVGMSRANFYRKIKALTNMSAAEFLKKLKFDQAAELLKTNKFRVSEVQAIIGISDADYFRNSFKSQFGVTPKQFIDSHQK